MADSEEGGLDPDMVAKRRYLLLASYCGGEGGCTNHRPCNDCLAMCNVFAINDPDPLFDRELGPELPGASPELRRAIARAVAAYIDAEADKRRGGLRIGFRVMAGNVRAGLWEEGGDECPSS